MNVSRNLILITLSFLISISPIISQTQHSEFLKKYGQTQLATVGNEPITYEQIERAYQKNISKQKPYLYLLNRDSIVDFIKLYSNYRLKVIDAKDKKLDKDSSVQAEIQQNRKILAESFLFEKKLTEPNVNLMLERRNIEAKVAIILTTFEQGPTKDTTSAFKKINEAMDKLKKGENFGAIAREYCDDKDLGNNGGVIEQWITSGKVQREIENAIYETQPGNVYPKIIYTPYAYFIVKVLAKEPRKMVLGGHILVRIQDLNDTLNYKKKVDSILTLIRNGASFEKLAKELSDDKFTADKNGSFDEYYSRSTGFEKNKSQLNPSFENALFTLKDGEISDVVKTNIGFHIIKRYATKNPVLDNERDDLRNLYRKQYYEFDKQAFLDSIYKEMKLSINERNLANLITYIDSNKIKMNLNWADSLPKEILIRELYSIQSKPIIGQDYAKAMDANPQFKSLAGNRDGYIRSIKKVNESSAIQYATRNLENEYPDFKILIQEFVDGILLFKAETMEVWEKLSFDTTRARKYWDSTKTRYIREPMYDISEIFVLSDSTAQSIYKQVIDGADFDTLASKFTQRPNYREKSGRWGLVSAKSNPIAKVLFEQNITQKQIVQPIKIETGWSIVKIHDYQPSRQKTFEEAIPDFASKMQDQVQKELLANWLIRIDKTHPVKINQKNIDLIMKAGKDSQ
ncbi:MAG: peptidylprolyl isomerase [Chloroherpetonaceae bacterium]